MSNVLIGIIGVILFIGLALAGALFLGQRFQDATATSQASAMTATLKQAVDAANLWRLDQGNPKITQQNTSFLAPGYLKTQLDNPAQAAAGQSSFYWSVYFNDDLWPESVQDTWTATLVQAIVGPEADAQAKNVCTALAKAVGSTVKTSRTPVETTGCSLINGQYIAWAKL